MAGYITVMSQADISILKDTLQAQQQLLQRLNNELDAERDSSASAASEALSVILRLQEEKAAIKMESEQYKRLVDEKMRHAEESMAITEDIIYQKEMEVSALNYQVRSYYHKLLSVGCVVDPDIGELRYPENVFQRNEALDSNKVVPVLPKFNEVMNECESNSLEMNSVDKIVEEEYGDDKSMDLEKKTDNSASGSINSYCEQKKELDERVLEISGASYANLKNEAACSSLSLSSKPSSGNLRDSFNCANFVNDSKKLSDAIKRPANLLQSGSAVDYHCSTNVHDVFEVPQIDRNLGFYELVTKGQKETDCEGSEKLERDQVVHPEAVRFYATDELDGIKKLSCKPSDIAAIDCHLAVSQPSASGSACRPRLNQLKRESETIEAERPAEATNREDEMKLLNEIKEQLNLLQNEVRVSKVKKTRVRDEPSLRLLSEAMIYFWL